MHKYWLLLALACSVPAVSACPDLLNHEFRRLASDQRDRLCEAYADQVLLVVNTASRCAFTPQYEGLEALYARYRDRGFAVIGFPSNDFGGQEPVQLAMPGTSPGGSTSRAASCGKPASLCEPWIDSRRP